MVVFAQIRTDLPINTGKNSVLLNPKPAAKNKLYIDFKTGNDNLEHRDFQKNVDVKIAMNGKPDLIFENVNENQNWPNNSIRRFTADLPENIEVQDIKTITINRGNAAGNWNNIDGAMADNWNLGKLTVSATISNKRYILADLQGNNQPLFRFVYENRNACSYCGMSYSYTFEHQYSNSTPSAITSTPMNAKIFFSFGTGGDNLEGGNDNNVNVTLKLKNNPKTYTLSNINAKRKWENFTEKSREMDILNSKDLDINSIASVEIRHTGGGGIGADNWDVDKIKISVSKDGVSKILVDKVGAPIHRFTGDSRILRVKVD